MNGYFHCELCERSIKIKSKKKHLNSQYHKTLSMKIISRFSIKNPDFLHIINILENYVVGYNKKFKIYLIVCNITFCFSGTTFNVKSNKWFNISACFYLRNFLLSKIRYFKRYDHKCSHTSEMNITFITDLRDMTYKHYLNQPKSMLEPRLNAILAKNPELIKKFTNSSHPLIGKYQCNNEGNGED